MHQNTLKLETSALVIVDVQTAFRASIADFNEIARRIAVFTNGANLLNLPILVTEQYPKGLGHTAEEISTILPESAKIIEKTAFSGCGAKTFNEQLAHASARQIIVAGLEAHICVNQTVHDLIAQDFQVHLLTDCISARSPENKQIAFAKMQASGAILGTIEMALFELLRDAQHEQFKAIQKLIK